MLILSQLKHGSSAWIIWMISGRKQRRQINSRKMGVCSRHRMFQRERRGISQVSHTNLEGIENKQRLQTLSIDNAWSNKNFLFYLTFRMLQHTSSEVNGYNCYKHLKNTKIKRGTGDKIKTMTKMILPIVDTTSRN